MEDVGSLIFYIILGLIAVIGSLQGKGKKKPGVPRQTTAGQGSAGRGDGAARVPAGGEHRATGMPGDLAGREPKASDMPGDLYEGSYRYEETAAGTAFGRLIREKREKSVSIYQQPDEDDIAASMNAAFALDETGHLSGTEPETEWSETIAEIFGKDGDEFDLRKAIVYSMILERKEYDY